MAERTPLPADFLARVAVHVPGAKGNKQASIIAAIQPALSATMDRFGIDSDARVACFAGQICHESDQFCTTEEYASGSTYEGRRDLGNTQPGDGKRFKGRGLIQLTGRSNYAIFGPLLGLDLLSDPGRAAEPVQSLTIACLFWQRHGLSALADDEDVEAITRIINGGLNGLAQRQAATDRAFTALGYTADRG